MKLVYLIVAHQNSGQLKNLIKLLDNTQHYFIVHIDKKSKIDVEVDLQDLKFKKNVFFIRDRINVYWGHFSQIECTLLMLKTAFKLVSKFDYLIYLSGTDLPIKSNKEIQKFYLKNKGKEYICAEALPRIYWEGNGGEDRVKQYYFYNRTKIKILNKFTRQVNTFLYKKLKIKRTFYKNLKLYGGSSWFSVTYNCGKYILNYLDNNPEYIKSFYWTICADEIFYQTIIMNSDFKKKVTNDNLLYLDWQSGPEYPRILRNLDYKKIFNSGKLYARKFNPKIDIDIINKFTKPELRANLISEQVLLHQDFTNWLVSWHLLNEITLLKIKKVLEINPKNELINYLLTRKGINIKSIKFRQEKKIINKYADLIIINQSIKEININCLKLIVKRYVRQIKYWCIVLDCEGPVFNLQLKIPISKKINLFKKIINKDNYNHHFNLIIAKEFKVLKSFIDPEIPHKQFFILQTK